MGEREVVLDPGLRQALQPVSRRGADPVGGPLDGEAGVLVEDARVQVPQHGGVVVAPNRDGLLACAAGR